MNLYTCTQNAKCVDKVNGYTCICIDGYSGDGFKHCNLTLVVSGRGYRISGVKARLWIIGARVGYRISGAKVGL